MISHPSYKQLLTINIILIVNIISCAINVKAKTIEPKFSNNFILNRYNLIQEQGAGANKLILGKPIERELAEGQTHTYSLYLEANQFVNAVIVQDGIDVIVRVYNPANEKIYEIDSPNGTEGDEPVYFISKSAGDYRLEVSPLESKIQPGTYLAKLVDQHIANSDDLHTVEGINTLVEARLLATKGIDQENRQLIIDKYEKAIENLGKGKQSLLKADAIYKLGNLYYTQQDFYKVETLYLEALEIQKTILGNNHPSIVSITAQLAEIYGSIIVNYAKAETLHLKAIEICKREYGDNDYRTSIRINGLGRLYMNKGDYAKAEPLLVQALDIQKKLYGDNTSAILLSLDNISGLCGLKGDYDQARVLLAQAVDICKKTYGDNSARTAFYTKKLALCYLTEDNNKARVLLTQVLDIYKGIYGDSHSETADTLKKLSTIYLYEKDYDKAETLLTQALGIYKKIYGNNHRSLISSNYGLAKIYLGRGNYTKAEALLVEAINSFIPDNFPSINFRLALAGLYCQKKEYDKCDALLAEALDIQKKIYGDNIFFNILAINTVKEIYEQKKDYKKTVEYNTIANDLIEIELTKNLFLGSEKSKQLYLQSYSEGTDFTLSLHLQSAPTDIKAAQSALTEILRRKGRTIDAISQNFETLRKKSSPESIALLDELAEKKKLFSDLIASKQSNLTSAQRQQQLKALENEIDKLEYKISEYSLEFRIQSQPITLQAVQQAIPKDFALVEFAYYHPQNPDTLNYGKPHYAVYLSDNQGVIKWADLGSAETIDKMVDELRENLSNRLSKLKDVKLVAKRLDEKIMKPVRKLAGQKNHFLIAPDGKLNLVPFAALVDEKGKFLIENTHISYLTSGRDLLRFQNKVESKQAPVIVGNPDFGTVSYAKEIDVSNKESIWSNLRFRPLPAAEEEAKIIKKLFPESTLLTGKQATEEAINNINAPLILHLATHGFFLKEEEKSLDADLNKNMITSRLERSLFLADAEIDSSFKIENPLLRSGIALAGANTQETTRGIFTAFRATSLNLLGTKLVVVSTCGSGLGEVKTGDGVYGLRRALLLAGSETQVISLWSIADKNTKDLMINYYTRLKKGDGRANALRRTQLGFLQNPDTNHPYYWASFIQSGEWANLDGER